MTYIIYAHKHPQEQDYKYIGCGKEIRAFAKNRKVDHLIWLEEMLQQYTMKDLVVPLAKYDNKQEAHDQERHLIKQFKPIFNLVSNIPQPKDHRNKISKTLTGVPFTEERKINISNATKKAMQQPSIKAKMAKAREGRTLSDEHKANIGKGLKQSYKKGLRS